jgi:hypothetical protein
MAAARMSPTPREGPIASGEPTVAGRTDAVCGTRYQPSRRHIDFFVLAQRLLITQTAWPTGDAILSALLAQFLPNGCCAHWELAGCPTREGTAHRQHGRLPGSGSERWFVRRGCLHSQFGIIRLHESYRGF